MKKLIAILTLLCVMLMPFAVTAEAVTWAEVGGALVEKLDLAGDFVALKEMGLALWLPEGMEAYEPSEEDAAAGRYLIFTDGECTLTIDAVNVEGMTLDQAKENAVANGMFEPEIVNINGLDVLAYKDEANNAGVLVLVDTNCNLIIFSFTPIDSEEAEIAFGVISSSLMPQE